MEIRDKFFLTTVVVVNLIASYAANVAAPTEVHMGDLYRIFYIHTPTAWVCYLTLGVSLLASILFLFTRSPKYDRVAGASAIMGVIYGGFTILVGSIWANAVWGVYWNWDPRETTTLILWIAYIGYVALRLSIVNVEKRASIGAIYNVLAFSTVPLSYISFKLWQSLHPQIITEGTLSITMPMIETLLLNLVAASLIYIYIVRTMYVVQTMEEEINTLIDTKGG